jgi:SAM-dependent methyltransferase
MEANIEHYLHTIIEEGIYSNRDNLIFHLKATFDGIDFKDKRILDIGGGAGLHSFYAACNGAKEVICLEPEAEGSTPGVIEKFKKLSKRLKCDNVILSLVTFQDFEPDGKTFDIILLYDSINHLDETACINLLKNDSSKAIYKKIFLRISSLLNKGAKLIICDCSRHNFFAFLRIRNPFLPPTMEWHKHQTPEAWADLLSDVGFVNPEIRWSSFNRLRYVGKVLLGNKFMAYFLRSHFCLIMSKS